MNKEKPKKCIWPYILALLALLLVFMKMESCAAEDYQRGYEKGYEEGFEAGIQAVKEDPAAYFG